MAGWRVAKTRVALEHARIIGSRPPVAKCWQWSGSRSRNCTKKWWRRQKTENEYDYAIAPPASHGRRACDRCFARRLGGIAADDSGHFSAARHSDDIRRPTLWRNGPGPNGRLSDLLLRVSLPLHHRHRAR